METGVTVHTQSQTNRNLHLYPGLALLLELESSKVPGPLLMMRHRKAFGAHVSENPRSIVTKLSLSAHPSKGPQFFAFQPESLDGPWFDRDGPRN